MQPTRRQFLLAAGSAIATGFLGLQRVFAADEVSALGREAIGYGPLTSDPEGLVNLPAGFQYRIISRRGETMDDGLLVPGLHDGMAAFPGPNGRTILVRNHEVNVGGVDYGPFGKELELLDRIDRASIYDPGVADTDADDDDAMPVPGLGGTTTLVYDTKSQQLEQHFLSLTGTLRNCAGGPTPWGSWISCEESVHRAGGPLANDHGYNFEVPATTRPGLADPIPLKAMGRFNHEAIAVDPNSGIVYETEDRGDGLIYRFIPNEPGQLAQGGRLQALVIAGRRSADTRHWSEEATIEQRTPLAVEWIDLDDVEAPEDDLRQRGFDQGAARFARGEGMWYGRESIFFACTNGGAAQKGQIWRYVPSPFEGTAEEQRFPGRLELYIEATDRTLIERADNLTVAPWGDLIVCEDGPGTDHLVGVTPTGRVYHLMENATNGSELAGATFAPDGSTLFVNVQALGITLAITGPWQQRRDETA